MCECSNVFISAANSESSLTSINVTAEATERPAPIGNVSDLPQYATSLTIFEVLPCGPSSYNGGEYPIMWLR